tara:strand:+ start:5 stop:172 length:168 start_codon:yes stop_codon:yes gene_type:complete
VALDGMDSFKEFIKDDEFTFFIKLGLFDFIEIEIGKTVDDLISGTFAGQNASTFL